MDIDFPLVLVVLTFATGLIWLLDVVFLRKRRLAVAEGASGEVTAEEEPKEPYLVDLSRSFFSGAGGGAGVALVSGGTLPDSVRLHATHP